MEIRRVWEAAHVLGVDEVVRVGGDQNLSRVQRKARQSKGSSQRRLRGSCRRGRRRQACAVPVELVVGTVYSLSKRKPFSLLRIWHEDLGRCY